MSENDRRIEQACPDQREAMRVFARTGNPAALAHVHFESCATCSRVLDTLTLVSTPPNVSARRRVHPADNVLRAVQLAEAGFLMIALGTVAFVGAYLFKLHDHRVLGLLFGTLMLLPLWHTYAWINTATDAEIAAYRSSAPHEGAVFLFLFT